jgi:poly(A) polymerase
MMNSLPPADWTRRDDLAALVAALDPAGESLCRWVGGAVRDTLLGLPIKDIDMATTLLPEAVMARLAAAQIRALPTGIAHGTVTALLAGGPVEITTLRRDVTTDGRHATVAFSCDWQEDASRRDFTINALYADPRSGVIDDYFGGRADLAARRVRFIGDGRARIREDYLRILRYFRFQARYGAIPADPDAESACAELAPGLKGLSRERVGWELMRLLAHPDPAPGMVRMAELGVLAQVLPEADPTPLPALVAAELREHVAPDPLRRLAAMLPADPPLADAIAARLRLSGVQRKRLAKAVVRETGDPRALAYRLGVTVATDRLLIAGESVATLHDWTPPVFALKGGDIVKRGITVGPQVAQLLHQIEDQWVAEGFPEQPRITQLLDAAVAGHTPD